VVVTGIIVILFYIMLVKSQMICKLVRQTLVYVLVRDDDSSAICIVPGEKRSHCWSK